MAMLQCNTSCLQRLLIVIILIVPVVPFVIVRGIADRHFIVVIVVVTGSRPPPGHEVDQSHGRSSHRRLILQSRGPTSRAARIDAWAAPAYTAMHHQRRAAIRRGVAKFTADGGRMNPQLDTRLEPRLNEPMPPFPEQHQPGVGLESKLDPRPRYKAEAYRPAGKLQGKVALVTGGDSGIGRAVALLYAREGANVAIVYLPEEQSDADETRKAIEAVGGSCLTIAGDLRDAAFCNAVVEQTVKHFGKLDILVANAAHQNRKPSLQDVTDEEFDATFKTNIYSYFRLARAALRHLQPGSAIIATSSETGIMGSPKLPDYSATKGAINAFTKALAINLLEKGIRVNAVAPGPVWTPLNPSDDGLSAKDVARFGQDSPMGRPAQPEELAPAYVFLASNADSSYVTGIVLQVMGGETTGG
jgi:NAD(P)-dependent dehydrogenase (short-subunit alcohol dehydrogenase family)